MRPAEDIVALNAEALSVREMIRSDAVALANRGLIAREQVSAFKGLVGYKNVAFELIDWANLIRDHWSGIQGKTALTEAEVQNAKDLGERLIRAAGLHDQAPVFQAEAARIRQQALTLMVGAYDATRRALAYLRWEERDAETIAPSLYAGKTRKAAGDTPPEPTPPEPTPPVPTPPVPTPPATTPPVPPVHAGANGTPAGLAAVAAGLPGSSPFTGA